MIGLLLDALLPWLGWAAGAIAAAVGLWYAGRRSKAKDVKADRAEANAKAGKEAKEIHHEAETSDDTYLTDVLSGRVRPKR